MTAPIRVSEIIVGKFISVYLVFVGMLLLRGHDGAAWPLRGSGDAEGMQRGCRANACVRRGLRASASSL